MRMDLGHTLMGQLKLHTQPHHEAIEQSMALDCMSDSVHHRQVMQTFLNFHAKWEPALDTAVDEEGRALLRDGSRWYMLCEDAEYLGLTVDAAVAPVPALTSQASAWGSAYVLWGSMLGGRVICRQMNAIDGDTVKPGWRYFYGHGERTGSLWRAFAQMLERKASQQCWDWHEAIVGAQSTFEALEQGICMLKQRQLDQPYMA